MLVEYAAIEGPPHGLPETFYLRPERPGTSKVVVDIEIVMAHRTRFVFRPSPANSTTAS